ncbi:hypothetical protein CIB95_13475 [Lottiidibacillus patelloidae]|uniref:Uncharacterized protein n=1 Tax=Lottiidibacillus patelloidae TaxID=2670334 RepID=A0A263BR07_9BACI|nr:hypothetical protein [Lottiidibacillus patelloidae]OZM56114.1 hypothetical protein CIB95_13475 [Lottiidibacillus patelloidae]
MEHKTSAMCQLLSTLNPGTKVNEIFMQGSSEQVAHFASYDARTRLATFVQQDGDLLVVDANRIDGVELNT